MSKISQLSNSLEAYILANRHVWKPRGCSPEQLAHRARQFVVDWANHAVNRNDITTYKINEVTHDNGNFVDFNVDKSVVPGQPHSIGGKYVGLVLGVRTEKRKRIATVMRTTSDGSTKISITVQPVFPLDYVEIKLVV